MPEEDLNETIKSIDEYDQYLTFNLGGELYGFEVSTIREVIEYYQVKSITSVPLTPDYIEGVINLRGEVIPVINLSCRLYGHRNEINKRTCIVIIEIEEDETIKLGAMIDSVNAVLAIPPDGIEAPMGLSANIRAEFIHGITRSNDKFIILLDIERTINIEELSNFIGTFDSEGTVTSKNL